MYIVIYNFSVKENKEKEFVEAWKGLTQLIYKYENSLGSRLHKKDNHNYIAYAQWPSKHVFESSGQKLPEEATVFRDSMRGSCEKVEILYKMEAIEDLLRDKTYD